MDFGKQIFGHGRYPKMTVAIHEAGHAVAAVHHGIGFRYVTIDAGHVKLRPVPKYAGSPKYGARAARYWNNRLIVALAGPAAHKKRHPYAHFLGHALRDFDEAYRIIKDMLPSRDAAHVYFDDRQAHAKEFVAEHWSEIEAVAAALVKLGTLTDVAVRQITRQNILGGSS